MKKSIVLLNTLLLACFVNTLAAEYPDFRVGLNGYIILKAEDGTLTDEVRLVGPDYDMLPMDTYCGGEDVPDEVTYDGKTYKVVEFGFFRHCYFEWEIHRLKFGKNMRKVDISPDDYGFFYMVDGFEVSEENKYLKAIDGILYTADGKKLMRCHPSLNRGPSPKSVTIPDDVETIGASSFTHCSYTFINHLPKSLKEIQSGAFMYSQILPDELVVPEGVRVIDRNVFTATSIRKLILPSTLERIGFFNATLKLETIVCLAPTPPAAMDEDGSTWWLGFTGFYQDQGIVLMVPRESVELYRQDPIWGEFFKNNIRAYDPTGIASLTDDNAKADKLYRLDGTPAQSTKPGFYVKNGKKLILLPE